MMDPFVGKDPDLQRNIFHSLSIERPVVPEELLEQHEQELASMEAKHQETVEAERKKLAVAEAEKTKAEEALKENSQKLEEIKERAKTELAKYEKTKGQITKEVRREVERELEEFKKERETREAAVKAKQDEIAELNGQIESLNNKIYGYDSQVALWRHEIARVSELYNHSIAYYSNPALIEVQLQVISEYVEALVRFSECHKWDTQASKIVERYHKSIGDFLQKLVKKVATNQKDVISLERSEKAIAAQGEVGLDAAANAR
jgi:chromosome segregation ATPase